MKMSIARYAQNIRIENRGTQGLFVLWNDAYGSAFRSFETIEIAERFAAGEEIHFALPKKGRKLPISATATAPPQGECWTERPTRKEIVSKPMVGFHFGFSGKELAAVETCFYAEWPKQKNQVPPGTIMVEIPAGTHVTFYDDEFRVCLDENMQTWKLQTGWLREATR